MWLRLQYRYELEKAQEEADPKLMEKIRPVAVPNDFPGNTAGK